MIYRVSTEAGSLTFFGGHLEDAGNGEVWLTSPAGEPLLKVPASSVKATTAEGETARLVRERETCNCDICRSLRASRKAGRN